MQLKDRLIKQIRMDGPIPVSAYMQTCLHDPKDGYYARGAGLGRDFITAPETSQIFGELIGAWAAQSWKAMGSPDKLTLCELGGGRGTLMADAMRVLSKSEAASAIDLHMIEASPALRTAQSERLADTSPSFVTHIEDLPTGHTLLVANEFLDCLPAHQFVQEDKAWRERLVGLDEAGNLAFGIDRSDLTERAAAEIPPIGLSAEAELQPGLDGLVDTLATRFKAGNHFHALFIDYGPSDGPPADTLRAYKNGKQVHPLACPGEADLTIDVDFGRLARLAARAGLQVSGPVTQGAFLGALGIEARLQTLIKANADDAQTLFEGAQKLVGPNDMGTRFKVICLSSPGLPAPLGF